MVKRYEPKAIGSVNPDGQVDHIQAVMEESERGAYVTFDAYSELKDLYQTVLTFACAAGALLIAAMISAIL